jgi:hypothetical protein
MRSENAYLFVFWRNGERLGVVIHAPSREAAARTFSQSKPIEGQKVKIEDVRKLNRERSW